MEFQILSIRVIANYNATIANFSSVLFHSLLRHNCGIQKAVVGNAQHIDLRNFSVRLDEELVKIRKEVDKAKMRERQEICQT